MDDTKYFMYTLSFKIYYQSNRIILKGGDSFSPRRMSEKFLMESKGNMSDRDWGALYMQRPTEEEGAIIKRKWWRKWPKDEPPRCEYILQCYDTAFEADETADPSARTTACG